MLCEVPFYGELNFTKTSKAFKGYARSYSIEIIDAKHSSVQLTISKLTIKDLFKEFLNEIKGYQITLKVWLIKYKKNRQRTYSCLFSFYY